jgi:hypothetical protein
MVSQCRSQEIFFILLLLYPDSSIILSKVSLQIIQFLNQISLLESERDLLLLVNNCAKLMYLNSLIILLRSLLIDSRLLKDGRRFFLSFS